MSKHTICSAALNALKVVGKPLTSEEIYNVIVKENLYEFNAKEPLNVLKSTLRKHTDGVSMTAKKGTIHFKLVNGKFTTLG